MKKLSLILTIIMLLCVLTACGAAPAAPASNAQPDVASSPSPEATAFKEQVVIGTQSKTTTTDPTKASNVAHNIMFQLTHNCLIGYDENESAIVPELATEWAMEENGKVWSFTLRDGVVFHNGEKMTPDDILFTWEFGKTAENATVKAFWESIENIEVIDATHIKINLYEVNVDFLYSASTPSMCIFSKVAVEADAENGPSIGSGAYRNVEFVAGDHTLLERNDDFWGETPYTKSLLFRYIAEGSTRLMALENHEIDVCQAPNNTELDLITGNDELKLDTYQATALTYLAFNMESELGQDENLRLAIAYALNVQDIIDGAAGGFAGIADGMWGFYQFGYFNDWTSVGQEAYTFNIDKAKEYIAASKHPDGLTITFTTSTTWRVNALQIIQQQLAPLGINVVIDEVDAAGLTSKANDGNYEVIMFSVTYTSAGNDSRRTLYPGYSANHARYNNERVTELLDLAAAETEEAIRLDYYEEVQTIVHAECPYIPLYYANSGAAYTAELEGAVFNASGAHDYTYVRIPD